MIYITDGNSKIGLTGNISLPPVLTCAPGVPCADTGCYAKMCFNRPNVRENWMHNLMVYRGAPTEYFGDIYKIIVKRGYQFFRWHVGGDIPDNYYLANMIRLAYLLPDTKFLAYTKRYEFEWDNFLHIPKNIVFVMSCWPGYPLPDNNFPKFWVQNGREYRIPENAVPCPGSCESCRICWDLKKGESVVIKKHGQYKGNPDQCYFEFGEN